MIKLRGIKYNKTAGTITACAEYNGDGNWYDISVDTKKWVVTGVNENVTDIILYKCRNKLRELISLNRKIPSKLTIMWY